MKALILGGTRFEETAIARAALKAVHGVTLFNRGMSNAFPFPGVKNLVGDRDEGLVAPWHHNTVLSAQNPGRGQQKSAAFGPTSAISRTAQISNPYDQTKQSTLEPRTALDRYSNSNPRQMAWLAATRFSFSEPPSATSAGGKALHLIQFFGPIQDQWLADLEATGAELVHYLGSYGYLVWADTATRNQLNRQALSEDNMYLSSPYSTDRFSLDGPELLLDGITHQPQKRIIGQLRLLNHARPPTAVEETSSTAKSATVKMLHQLCGKHAYRRQVPNPLRKPK